MQILLRFDPDRFSPDKEKTLPPFAFEPFGFAGKRKCPGYRVSLVEATTLLATILGSNLKLALAPDQVVTVKADIVNFPMEEIWITAKPVEEN